MASTVVPPCRFRFSILSYVCMKTKVDAAANTQADTQTETQTGTQAAARPGAVRYGIYGALSGLLGAALGGAVAGAVPAALALIGGVISGPLSPADLAAVPLFVLVGAFLGVVVGGLPGAVAGTVLGVWLRGRPIERGEGVVVGCVGLLVTAGLASLLSDGEVGRFDPAVVGWFLPVGVVATLVATVTYNQFTRRFRF